VAGAGGRDGRDEGADGGEAGDEGEVHLDCAGNCVVVCGVVSLSECVL